MWSVYMNDVFLTVWKQTDEFTSVMFAHSHQNPTSSLALTVNTMNVYDFLSNIQPGLTDCWRQS